MTTEERSPTGNSGDWLNGANAYSANGVCATVGKKNQSHFFTDYGFSIGAGKSIVSVKVKPLHVNTYANEFMQVAVSWDGGSTWSSYASVDRKGSNCGDCAEDIVDATELTDWTPEKLSNSNLQIQVRSRDAVGGCFKYGSKILLPDGSTKRIEDIKEGERIQSWRFSKKLTDGCVIAITHHKLLTGLEVCKITPEKGEPLICTHEHMVCISKDYRFKEAQNVEKGDLLISHDKTFSKVIKVERITLTKMMNLGIDKGYLFVNGWLVHNIVKEPW